MTGAGASRCASQRNATALTIERARGAARRREQSAAALPRRQRTFRYVSAADVMQNRAPRRRIRRHAGLRGRDRPRYAGSRGDAARHALHRRRSAGHRGRQPAAARLLPRPAAAPLAEGAVTLAAAGLVALTAARFGSRRGRPCRTGVPDRALGRRVVAAGALGAVLSPVLPTASTVFAVAGVALTSTARAARSASADLLRARADAEAAAHAHHEFLTTVSREAADAALRYSGLRAHGQPRRAGRRPQGAGAVPRWSATRPRRRASSTISFEASRAASERHPAGASAPGPG